MNKIFNYCTMLLLSVLTLALGSCTEEFEYSAAKVEGAQVYFSNTLPSTQNLSNTESSFSIQLNRVMTSDELTVNLTLSDASGLYSIPSSVTFAQGDSTATIKVSYDPSKLEYEVMNDVTIAIADADYTTPYGNSSYSFRAGMPSPYVSLGLGKFENNYLISGYAEVEIMQNQLNPNEFRIMHPYDDIAEFLGTQGLTTYPDQYPEYLQVTIMQPGDELNGQVINESDLVYFNGISTGVDIFNLGAPAEIWHPANFQNGDITHNKVTAYQENGLPGTIQLAPFYFIPSLSQGADKSTTDGDIIITFPGYNPVDYSVSVSYLGAFVSADETSYAMGNLTMGADVDEVHVGVVEGSDANNAVNQVLGGSVETTTLTESGEFRIPCNYSGDCTLVAIAYADGVAQNYSTAAFSFTLTPGEWTSIGTGLYTDHVFCLNLVDQNGNPAPPIEYSVEVQENTKTPGVYRLKTPYAPDVYGYSGDFGYDTSNTYNIIINASDPDAVYITAQPIGFSDSQLGNMLILSNGGAYIDAGYDFDVVKNEGYIKGKLTNGVITFEPKELMFSFDTYYAEGRIGYANETMATSVLKLPSAVTSQMKARAAKLAKSRKSMRLKNKTLRIGNLKGVGSFRFGLPKKFKLNSDTSYKRK